MTGRVLRYVLATVAAILMILVVLIDLHTEWWQTYVIVSGLAAGLVTFALTTLVIDRMIAKSQHERLAPITRVALRDIQRELTAAEHHLGEQRVRRLPDYDGSRELLEALDVAAVEERDALTNTLAKWTAFLSVSADVTDIVDTVADIAERLDLIDEHIVTLRNEGSSSLQTDRVESLRHEITAYHAEGDELLEQIERAVELLPRRQAPLHSKSKVDKLTREAVSPG